MKKIDTKTYAWAISLSTLFFCWNGSVINTDASQATTEPDINFYGTLEDHSNTANIESILIGSKYESIPVYQQIVHHDKSAASGEQIDPKQNKILINLQDIKSISLAHPENPIASSIKVNNKIYIQIIIEMLHGTKKKYLVESTRKISCKEIDKSDDLTAKPTLQDRDINFMHVKKLTIQGYKSNYPYQAPKLGPISQDSQLRSTSFVEKVDGHSKTSKDTPADTKISADAKKEFKNNAAELLHAIEENVKNMPMDNPSAFETMRSTVLTLLKSLRDQLQKFLDMIK